MKSLTEYIVDSLLSNNKNLKDYEWNNNLLYSFEEFCLENNVNSDNEILLDDAYNFYKNHHWEDNGLGEHKDYYYFQSKLYETLLNSHNSYRLVQDILNKFNKHIIDIKECPKGNPKTENKFFIDIHALDDDFLNNKKFISLLNQYNHYVLYSYDNNDGYRIRLRPHFSDEKTNDIYKEQYVYHLSKIEYVDKILKYGLEPKAKNDKIHRVYILRKNKNFDNQIQSLMGNNTEKCLFTIDLSKTKNKLRFFLDEGATGYDAYFTLDNIPKECLIKYEIINKKYFNI